MVLGMGLFILGINWVWALARSSDQPQEHSLCGLSVRTPCRLPERILCWPLDHVLHWFPDRVLRRLLLWLQACGLPLNSCQVYRSHFAGLRQSPWPSGRQPVGPPHMLAGEPIPFHFQEHLRPQQRMSAFAAYPKVKRGSPGLPFSFSLPHKRGTLVLCLGDTCCDIHPSVLFGMWYPIRCNADWSTSEFGSLMLLWWPWQHIRSASFCPRDATCKNISCKITDRCGDPMFHQGYSSKKRSVSTTHSASLKESPSCSTIWWASRVFSLLFP